jgi:uncharacterized membrane protein
VNLHDLAEWVGLIPRVRYAAELPMLIPGLLRIIPALIAVALSAHSVNLKSRPVRWAIRVLALLICVGLLPPLEFYRGNLGDVNYRQQAIIAVIGAVGVLIMVWRPVRMVTILCSVGAALCSIIGFVMSRNEFAALKTDVRIGAGLVVIVSACILFIIAQFILKRL